MAKAAYEHDMISIQSQTKTDDSRYTALLRSGSHMMSGKILELTGKSMHFRTSVQHETRFNHEVAVCSLFSGSDHIVVRTRVAWRERRVTDEQEHLHIGLEFLDVLSLPGLRASH